MSDRPLRLDPTACFCCGREIKPHETFTAEDIDSGERWVVCRECGDECDDEAREVLRERELGRDHLELLRGPSAPSSPAPETE